MVVTPLGVFDFATPDKSMRLASLHPGVSADEVRDNTGFDLAIPDDVPTTPEPTDEEMFQRRRMVDTTGGLAAKFPWPTSTKQGAR